MVNHKKCHIHNRQNEEKTIRYHPVRSVLQTLHLHHNFQLLLLLIHEICQYNLKKVLYQLIHFINFCELSSKRLCLILTGNSSSMIHVKNSAPRREDRSSLSSDPTLGISLTYSSSISAPLPLRNLMYALDTYMKNSTPQNDS